MKEKRILCIEVSGECRCFTEVNTPLLADAFECQQGLYCTKNTAWKPITKYTCKNCKEGRYQGLTREQAIERMKNAGLKYACRANGRDIPEEVHHHYANMMEAALNALVEDKK